MFFRNRRSGSLGILDSIIFQCDIVKKNRQSCLLYCRAKKRVVEVNNKRLNMSTILEIIKHISVKSAIPATSEKSIRIDVRSFGNFLFLKSSLKMDRQTPLNPKPEFSRLTHTSL